MKIFRALFVILLAVAVGVGLAAVLGINTLADGAPFRPRVFDDAEQPSYVVRVDAHTNDLESDVGTGTVIDNGLVVTNHHVVRGLRNRILDRDVVTVTFSDGTTHDAVVLKYDADDDFALIEVPTAPETDIAPLAEGPPDSGDVIRVGGFPLAGKYREVEGKVSGFGAPLRTSRRDSIFYFNARTLGGMSGAGAFNEAGELVGVMFGNYQSLRAHASDVTALRAFLADTKFDVSDARPAVFRGCTVEERMAVMERQLEEMQAALVARHKLGCN